MVDTILQGHSDIPPITPEGVVADIISQNIGEVLGNEENILYIRHKKVKMYVIQDWKIYIWPDQRGQENMIFISPEYVGKNHDISWYIGRKLASKGMLKNPDQREFIARCIHKEVTPESLSQ